MQRYLKPNKDLGQNFLIDQNIAASIVRQAGKIDEHTTILEIGPGTGALTQYLIKSGAKKIFAVEKDARCIEILNKLEMHDQNCQLEVINCDAIKLCERSIISGKNNKIISNLPYNISTVLIMKWLDMLDLFSNITVMVQKEVAERITANPGSKKYGKISVMIQLFCHAQTIIEVPREVFFPQPKVLSSVIQLTPREKPLFQCNIEKLQKVCQAAFSQRRKMIRSSLKNVFTDTISNTLSKYNIDETKRAEDLSIEEFCTLSNAL